MPSVSSGANGKGAALIASVDRLTLPADPPQLSPQSLPTVVRLFMESRFPVHVCWGAGFIHFYTDPLRPIHEAAKHPATGTSAPVTFAEAWHIIGPLFDRMRDDSVVRPLSARELRARVEARWLPSEIWATETAHDRQLADLFRHAPVAVALLRGSEHVFDFANDEYMSVVGRGDLVGKRIVDALPELVELGLVAILDDVYASGHPCSANAVPLTLNRGEGGASEQTYFNFVYLPLRNHRGDVEGIAVVAVEVTALIGARNEADAANRAKDQFLAVLGHELRTPLAPILTAVRLLELKESSDPDLQKLRRTIARQAQHMQRLIDDLLDVGRIISGKLRLEKDRVDLATLLERAVEAASPAIERRHHTLAVVMPDNPIYLDADATRFTQVLWNLLNNAAKFMSEGGRIELSAEEVGGTAVVRVRDHGIGIAHEMLECVFDRFVQASLDDKPSEGLGIGLAVAKTIVELHGGTIVARSDGPGTGSDFTVTLPVTQGRQFGDGDA